MMSGLSFHYQDGRYALLVSNHHSNQSVIVDIIHAVIEKDEQLTLNKLN